jgi:hypothetical protein
MTSERIESQLEIARARLAHWRAEKAVAVLACDGLRVVKADVKLVEWEAYRRQLEARMESLAPLSSAPVRENG